MRSAALVAIVLGSCLAISWPVHGQASDVPPFVVGPNKLYCHATTDGLTGWINSLLEDGDEAPYYLTGEGTIIPGAGVGVDPVAQEAVDAHIPLMPALDQTIAIGGTVTVQAFIGSGAYGGGVGSFGTSLMAGTTTLGSAPEVEHQMAPHNSNVPGGTGPYEEITWTFEVPVTPIPAGTPIEWVISGTVEVGNNVFLACNAARGNSNIDIPVVALDAGDSGGGDSGGDGNSTGNSTTSSTVSVSSSTSSSTTTTSRSTTSTSSSRSTTAGNTTAGNGTADEKDSPAPPLAFAGLAVLLAAVAVRRRLR